MIGRISATLPGLALAAQIAVGSAAAADGFADCVRKAASQDLTAKSEFQRGLRDLIVGNRPGFEGLATVSMELQILLAEARRARFDYLLAHDPDRIETAKGLRRFSNFDWSEDDSARFMEQSGSYRELENRVAAVEQRNNGHPDWPEMRAYFRAELSQSPEFQALTARLRARQGDVEAAVAACRRE